jgi:hypothetical protein
MARTPSLEAAEAFIRLNARLIDRHRYDCLFRDGDTEQVLAALRPYQNADGGFGNALEPDFRGPVSQPVTVESALRVLDEVNAFDDPMTGRACDYLGSITPPEGGVPFVLPSVRAYPRAPWWEAGDDPPASLLPTASIAGLLHRHRVAHPWLAGATEYCWRGIEGLTAANPYEMRAVLTFLEYAPDRERAKKAFARVGPMTLEQGLVELDPAAPGEVHGPLDFAPTPESLARSLFTDDQIEAHLDAMVAAQQSDGGWWFNWQAWNPATTLEWRGWLTVRNLQILRAYGRLR